MQDRPGEAVPAVDEDGGSIRERHEQDRPGGVCLSRVVQIEIRVLLEELGNVESVIAWVEGRRGPTRSVRDPHSRTGVPVPLRAGVVLEREHLVGEAQDDGLGRVP